MRSNKHCLTFNLNLRILSYYDFLCVPSSPLSLLLPPPSPTLSVSTHPVLLYLCLSGETPGPAPVPRAGVIPAHCGDALCLCLCHGPFTVWSQPDKQGARPLTPLGPAETGRFYIPGPDEGQMIGEEHESQSTRVRDGVGGRRDPLLLPVTAANTFCVCASASACV